MTPGTSGHADLDCVIGWGVITYRTYRQIIGWGVIEPVPITPLRGASGCTLSHLDRWAPGTSRHFFFFFFTLVTGTRRSLNLKLSDTRVYEPQIRARQDTPTRAACSRCGVQRFRGGLVFKAHRLSVSLTSRLESNKEEEKCGVDRDGTCNPPQCRAEPPGTSRHAKTRPKTRLIPRHAADPKGYEPSIQKSMSLKYRMNPQPSTLCVDEGSTPVSGGVWRGAAPATPRSASRSPLGAAWQ